MDAVEALLQLNQIYASKIPTPELHYIRLMGRLGNAYWWVR